MIRERRDLIFFFITKRINRLRENLPEDWNDGYDHVVIGCTCENQKRVDERLPVFRDLPLKHRVIICEPLLERINLKPYLDEAIEYVVIGGESGMEARHCRFEWVLSIRDQCMDKNVTFHFKQTGANFFKDGIHYRISRHDMHLQASKAGIDFLGKYQNFT